MCKLVTRKRDS